MKGCIKSIQYPLDRQIELEPQQWVTSASEHDRCPEQAGCRDSNTAGRTWLALWCRASGRLKETTEGREDENEAERFRGRSVASALLLDSRRAARG